MEEMTQTTDRLAARARPENESMRSTIYEFTREPKLHYTQMMKSPGRVGERDANKSP